MAETSITDTNARRASAQILDVRENVEIGSGMISRSTAYAHE